MWIYHRILAPCITNSGVIEKILNIGGVVAPSGPPAFAHARHMLCPSSKVFTHGAHFVIPPVDNILTGDMFIPHLFNQFGEASRCNHTSLNLN
jgi:hypothetical protein